MSNLSVRGNVSGTGTVILESPNTNSNRTVTLPDATTTLVGTDAAQTLTNKTIQSPTIQSATIQSSTLQGGALTLMTAVAASGTAVDFTGIPSWAKRITVILSGVSLSGTANMLIQIGDSGGIEATGYLSLGYTPTSTASSTTGFILNAASTAALGNSGSYTITLISGTAWVCSGMMAASGTTFFSFGTGNKTLSDVLDRVRITSTGADTFDGGTINVLYEG